MYKIKKGENFMSRSYKKTPYAGDKKGTLKKRVAWKTVRQYLKDHPEEKLNGNLYKKIFSTWDICDYCWITTWKDYWLSQINAYEQGWFKEYPNKEEEYRYWLKHYKVK